MSVERYIVRLVNSEMRLADQLKGAVGGCHEINKRRANLHELATRTVSPEICLALERATHNSDRISMLPFTPGYGCTGEATIRAAHGGTLEPGYRSNR